MENGGNRLRQPRTLEIRRATSWVGLYNGNYTIRRHTIPSGDVGPVVFRPIADVVAHSEGWCLRAVPALSNEVSRRIQTIPRVANRFSAFFSVAAVDRKWFSGAVLDVSNDQNRLGQPRAVRINQEITPVTRETAPENYFRFAAAIFENGGYQLGQPWTVEIHR